MSPRWYLGVSNSEPTTSAPAGAAANTLLASAATAAAVHVNFLVTYILSWVIENRKTVLLPAVGNRAGTWAANRVVSDLRGHGQRFLSASIRPEQSVLRPW